MNQLSKNTNHFLTISGNSLYIQSSPPPNTTILGTGEKPAVFCNGGIGREYTLKKPYLGLEMGGGIGREAVLGGVVLGGRTV